MAGALFILLTCGLAYVTGQTETAESSATSTVSLFLPIGSAANIYGSIISASPNQTAYALDCGKNTTNCDLHPSRTVTQGPATLRYTGTYSSQSGDSSSITPAQTIQCSLGGARLDLTPIQPATSAVCTASSAIAGLGIVASTSTLARSEIRYMPVTVTAGVEKLAAASSMAAGEMSGTTTAGAPALTAFANLGIVGFAAVFGVM